MIQNINRNSQSLSFKGRIDGYMPVKILREGATVLESIKFDNLASSPTQEELIKNILSKMEISKSRVKLTDDLKAKVQELFSEFEKIIGKQVPFDEADSAIFLKAVKKKNGELKGVSYSKYFPPQDGGSVNLNFSFNQSHLFEKYK